MNQETYEAIVRRTLHADQELEALREENRKLHLIASIQRDAIVMYRQTLEVLNRG